ncbi:MAG: hypothetical protein V3T83_01325, partial [Acidobacteriota bacterium]
MADRDPQKAQCDDKREDQQLKSCHAGSAARAYLEQLGLMHASERLTELINEAVKNNRSAHLFLDEL